ncbi:MAG: glutamine--fructose-6-phosphate transaminase (isomerizing) [Bacteroidetes bacterium]|nr:glutamine--fructose-6-phosphate transaminase (isomerizing) [Bacteroidota bacterium]
MCGIIGYSGNRDIYNLIIKGLKRLEYRGYDSAGLAVINGNKIKLHKKAGKVTILETLTKDIQDLKGNIGMGHTRWATHGEVNDINAHPHLSNSENIAIIHNGIIENYLELKKELELKGYKFRSQTDTEVLVNLIEHTTKANNIKYEEGVRLALKKVIGQYAIIILSKEYPDLIIAAKKEAPLTIGIGNDEFFIASDITPILEYTKEIFYLEDSQMVIIKDNNLKTISINDNKTIEPKIDTINLNIENIDKGEFDFYMLKEIFEQPQAIENCIKNFMYNENSKGIINIKELDTIKDKLINANRIIILACGSSLNSALFGKYILEEYCKIPVIIEQSAEFKYRNPVIFENDIVIGISQSGETADTLRALEMTKKHGCTIISICNVFNSSITRLSDITLYTNAGPEIGVASTKGLITQMITLIKMTLWIALKKKQIDEIHLKNILEELKLLNDNINKVFLLNDKIQKIAKWLSKYNSSFFLGRGYSYSVALEGALKLKELSYIHAEGYASAEMKHGPIALIDENLPTIYIATEQKLINKNISNIQEIKARKGKIAGIFSENSKEIEEMEIDFKIFLPQTNDLFMPILSTIALQLLAYHTAIVKNCNVDMPKNLAKSVTVE